MGIVTKDLGYDVYGVRQHLYEMSSGGDEMSYDEAMGRAALESSAAVEQELQAVAALVRLRQRKVSDLGQCLAVITQAIATLSVKNPESDDKSDSISELRTIASVLARYGITPTLSGSDKVRRDDAERLRINIEAAIDAEDNLLQRDLISVTDGVRRRDSAYERSAKVMKRAVKASRTIIGGLA